MCRLCPEDSYTAKTYLTHTRPCSCKIHRDDLGTGFPKQYDRTRDWYSLDGQWVSSVTGEVLPSRDDVSMALEMLDTWVLPIVRANRLGSKTGAQLAALV